MNSIGDEKPGDSGGSATRYRSWTLGFKGPCASHYTMAERIFSLINSGAGDHWPSKGTQMERIYEITFAPATGPYARATLPTTPLEVKATAKSRPASSSATKNATVGPDPETIAPSAPYS